MRWVFVLLALGHILAAQPPSLDTTTPIGQAFERLYNFDFPGAQAILDSHIRQEPQAPLPFSVKAAAYLFSELHRLKILEFEFFDDDDSVISRKRLKPDPAVRAEFFRLVEEARQRADTRLAEHPNDREALFAHCMAAGVVTDYASLIEKRRLGSFSLARKTTAYASQLLALDPPYYDAHLSFGTVEYVMGSLPFFIRWFIHVKGVEGSKQKAIENLQIVAQQGKYYGPFARILLAVIHLREKRPRESEKLLAELALEFPENPLIRKELLRVRELARGGTAR